MDNHSPQFVRFDQSGIYYLGDVCLHADRVCLWAQQEKSKIIFLGCFSISQGLAVPSSESPPGAEDTSSRGEFHDQEQRGKSGKSGEAGAKKGPRWWMPERLRPTALLEEELVSARSGVGVCCFGCCCWSYGPFRWIAYAFLCLPDEGKDVG